MIRNIGTHRTAITDEGTEANLGLESLHVRPFALPTGGMILRDSAREAAMADRLSREFGGLSDVELECLGALQGDIDLSNSRFEAQAGRGTKAAHR